MHKVKFSYRMELQFSEPVWNHAFSLRAFPVRLPHQQIGGLTWHMYPNAALQFHQDYFGNTVGVGRFDQSHSAFRFELNGLAWIHQAGRKQEACLPIYRYPSEACGMTAPMHDFLQAEGFLSSVSAGSAVQQAAAMMDALYRRFQYQPGVTSADTKAGEAFLLGSGVCQDYAQILIAFCRAHGIAARYVAGMIPGEGATHAWVEVYDNDMWHGLDPTQNKMVDDNYLKLAQGRDAMDCRLNRGVFSGRAIQQQNVNVTLEELL